MKNYKLVNNITGWLAFAVAAVTYLLTIEPTASFWDCPEFISTAFRQDVGHPPGAPFFMLIGRFFALFASDVTKVAMMINAMSALFSALTILFLFWTITHMARKVIVKNDKEISLSQIIAIMGAGLVGALAYTFSDTFWFSAVEGEVYAFSSLFTAVVFWAILKWEDASNDAHADRWIIFIAYMMGLSIGVHLLNLLAIPAIALVYYFKKKDATIKGTLLTLLASFVILGLVMYGFVQGSVEVAGWFDLFFVNTLGFSFNSGAIVYVVCVIAIMVWGIYETYRGKSATRMQIAFVLAVVILGIPFIGNSIILPVLIVLGMIVWFAYKGINRRFAYIVLLSLTVLFAGYSTYAVIVIRSLANPAMDQNAPNNMFALKSYLNREQYGDTPLFYGQYYNSEVKFVEDGAYCRPSIKQGEKLWMKATTNDGRDLYKEAGRKESYEYTDELCTIFPRMYSAQPNHIRGYETWGQIEGKPVSFTSCGRTFTVTKPTFMENLRYFVNYQVRFMYWRYFMWNFSGRQNDIQGHGEITHGNWITGFNFIDNALIGDQTDLPKSMAENKGHNKYYMLPLLLGLLGLCFQLYSGKKGTESFWITFFLFFMTGFAIILYLNQTPYQPRERDYAYAGSFYAFAIWIGFGVLTIIRLCQKFVPKEIAAIAVSIMCLGVPALMAQQNWDDHDRSDRYTCRDFGYNYLITCAPNAVIFTNGDNDTFPLWYLQEVEGVRRDVRVCNLSYLQTDWYIDQMRRGYYESAALPIKMDRDLYAGDNRSAPLVNSANNPIMPTLVDRQFELGDALKVYGRDMPNNPNYMPFMPSQHLYMNIDADHLVRTGTVQPEDTGKVLKRLPITLGERIFKNEYAILDMLYNNNWERPIYYAYTTGNEAGLGMYPYTQLEGIARRIVPIDPTKDSAFMYDLRIDTDLMYDNMMKKYRWGGIDNPKVYLDENNLRSCFHFRILFARMIEKLIQEGKKDKALEALDYCLKVMPVATVPSDHTSTMYADGYYKLGEKEKAQELLKEFIQKMDQELAWFLRLEREDQLGAAANIRQNIELLQEALRVASINNDEKLVADYYEKELSYRNMYESLLR